MKKEIVTQVDSRKTIKPLVNHARDTRGEAWFTPSSRRINLPRAGVFDEMCINRPSVEKTEAYFIGRESLSPSYNAVLTIYFLA